MKEKLHTNIHFADWIEGKITDEEVKKLVSQEEYFEFLKFKKGFDVLAALEAPMDATFEKIKAKTTAHKEKRTKIINLNTKWFSAVAAALIIAFGIFKFNQTGQEVFYVSQFGEQKTIALLDGSEVILNAKSTLKYNKKDWKNKRELFLEGEAYFKVTKGSTFTVNTDKGSVTVLGTQFNVSSKGDYFDVVCYEGRVQVTASNYIDILTPGKSVSINKGESTAKTTALIAPEWIAGKSSFEHKPLGLVLDELEKQFNVHFDRNNINQQATFTGSFDHKKLNLALASVLKPMGIKYKIAGKNISLYK
jgi:ferric-dicitrate binding protein FerR (iron transport regulator)